MLILCVRTLDLSVSRGDLQVEFRVKVSTSNHPLLADRIQKRSDGKMSKSFEFCFEVLGEDMTC